MFQKLQGTDTRDKLLTINIVDITYNDYNMIPKIEHKDYTDDGIQTKTI